MRTQPHNPPLWLPPVFMMAIFTWWAIAFAIIGQWWFFTAAIFGVLAAAAGWLSVLNLRATIAGLNRARVQDAYRISGLERDLERARRWNS